MIWALLTWEPCWSLPLFTIDTVPFFLCLILGIFSDSKKCAWSPYSLLQTHTSSSSHNAHVFSQHKHNKINLLLTRTQTLLLGPCRWGRPSEWWSPSGVGREQINISTPNSETLPQSDVITTLEIFIYISYSNQNVPWIFERNVILHKQCNFQN